MHPSSRSNDTSNHGLWLIVVAASLWGTVGPITQALYGMADTTPLTIILLRVGIATPVLLLACWRVLGPRMFRVPRRDLAIMMLIGILMALDQAAYFFAIAYAGAAVATLLVICSAPVLVALASVLFFREPITARIALALVSALIGTVLLVGIGEGGTQGENSLLGLLFSFLSAVGIASVILAGRYISGRYHPLQVTSLGFAAGTVVLFFIALPVGIKAAFPPEGWLLVIYLGVVPSALGYGLFLAGMRTTPSAVASIAVLMEPLVATALTWIVFGEYLGPLQLLGGVLLCSAIIFLARGEPSRIADAPAKLE